MHSTNYTNTFIAVADDCKAAVGAPPPEKQAKTIARMHDERIPDNPYRYTSDDVLFAVYAVRNRIEHTDVEAGDVFRERAGVPAFLTTRKNLWMGNALE
ncbi:MAG: DUF6157 family protein [Chloroflexales bacterium]|nr:DUF6157 family protein [Chloroflexales bacterium]